jgi:hypothetical protein
MTYITKCRSCASSSIQVVLEIGDQALSGVFRSNNVKDILSGPLTLISCDSCNLVQLANSYPLEDMYNVGYGYKSGLTLYMRQHLKDIIKFASGIVTPSTNDTILDIGSNDGTLLNSYDDKTLKLIGIDPVAAKYLDLYPKNSVVVTDFFTKENYFSVSNIKSKIVTSVSMFYDLEDPVKFVKSISDVLHEEGVWVFEQSYLPAMLRYNSYDTICHEHIEYYSLAAIQNILDKANLTIIDASQNEVNGGSIRLAAAHKKSRLSSIISPELTWLKSQEINHDIFSHTAFLNFDNNIIRHKNDLVNLLTLLNDSGKKVLGYGASTKGNVILQFCGIGPDLLPFIGDITPLKDGTYTPGSLIPIISMEKAKSMMPDYFLVLPWAFRNDILLREKELLSSGTKFIFPLPYVEIIN